MQKTLWRGFQIDLTYVNLLKVRALYYWRVKRKKEKFHNTLWPSAEMWLLIFEDKTSHTIFLKVNKCVAQYTGRRYTMMCADDV